MQEDRACFSHEWVKVVIFSLLMIDVFESLSTVLLFGFSRFISLRLLSVKHLFWLMVVRSASEFQSHSRLSLIFWFSRILGLFRFRRIMLRLIIELGARLSPSAGFGLWFYPCFGFIEYSDFSDYEVGCGQLHEVFTILKVFWCCSSSDYNNINVHHAPTWGSSWLVHFRYYLL
jgi:hypothetical protein